MTKKSYVVTDVGGPRPDIAGKRRKVDEVILLTEKEAEWELSRGLIITQEDYDAKKLEKSGGKAKAPGKAE